MVDKEDPCLEKYKAIELPEGWNLQITNGRRMNEKFVECWDLYKDLDAITIINDDMLAQTKNWDDAVLSQITGRNIVFTNDGMRFPNIVCGAITISGQIFRALGYLFPPKMMHLYSDDFWGIVGNKAGCLTAMPDVMMRHDHVFVHKQEDQTHKEVYAEESWKADTQAFEEWKATQMEKDCQTLIDLQQKTGVMLASPCHDGWVALTFALGLADSLLNLSQHRIHFEVARVVGSSLIPHARNSLVDMFMKSKCQKLLFADTDQGFSGQHVLMLLNSSRRIISGVVPHKRFPINLNFDPMPEHEKYFKSLTNKSSEEFSVYARECGDALGEVEVQKSGTGFMMIDRSVFEIMKEHVGTYRAFDNANDETQHHEYFWMGGHNGRFRGEDWKFVEMAKSLDIPIFIQTNVTPTHFGSFEWTVQRT